MSKDNNIEKKSGYLGGKSKGLTILRKLGYRVPEYIVIPYDQNIDSLELIATIKNFGQKFDRFAVRSSANIEDGDFASFAGQFNSFLNVPEDQLLTRIDEVRKSASNEHVKDYCRAMGLSFNEINMNVIIQKFEEPLIGGVWMGKGISGGRLEWVQGRGDVVVNGESIPFYENYDEKGQLLEMNSKEILTDRSGKSIAEQCKNIQSKLGYDSDIEFCITVEGIQWLQLRRVTKNTSKPIKSSRALNEMILKGEVASPYVAKGLAYRLDQEKGAGWSTGKILIARATSPNDMMYIMTAEGVVTKMGGMLSHSAVVCRELGKACVVGVDIEKIFHNKEILVEGILGEVHLL